MTLDSIRAKIPLNFELLGNPINWVIVLLMIAIAAMAINLIFATQSTGD